MSPLSRRQLLRRLAALALGTIGGSALSGCSPKASPAEATATAPAETPVPSVTPTLAPPPPRPEIIRFYPDVPSTVVRARHQGVWQGENLSPAAVREMLDASITALTGLTDARSAWAALFRPHERVAVKVNVFQNSVVWTHLPLVTAVTDSLQEAGVPPEQIVIYDNLTSEFKTAGYPVNADGPGVRCYGSDRRHTAGWKVTGLPVRLSDALLECDALINMPILKTHSMSGITYALKNHFGTVSSPQSLHRDLELAIAELNALPAIRDRARLVIGDALAMCLQEETSWPYWREATPGDSILVSYDPVAVDALGLKVFSEVVSARGGDPTGRQEVARIWLQAAAELGLGAYDEPNMTVKELALT